MMVEETWGSFGIEVHPKIVPNATATLIYQSNQLQ